MKLHDPKKTNALLHNLIEQYGIRAVRKEVYPISDHEIIAMANFINSRMHADEILTRLKTPATFH
jgi:hypothetical protein